MAKTQDREATIKTAVVEIKALTVSGKQITLAVFRQLEERALSDEGTLQLRGAIPTGWRELYRSLEALDQLFIAL